MTKMLLARFALNYEALAGCQIATLPFAHSEALDDLLGFVLQNEPKRQAKKPKWDWSEYPPFDQLNDVLTGSATSLVHGFNNSGETEKWPKSEFSVKPRSTLALTEIGGSPIWIPSIDQINDLVFTWAERWVKDQFKVDKIRGGSAKIETMRQAIYAQQTDWSYINAAELWKQYTDEENTLVWSALSSVLAALFVHRMQGKTFLMDDGEKTQEVTWQLTQEGNGRLAVVSEPFPHGKAGTANEKGFVAYKLEFVLQTVAGSNEPWIGVFVSRRRFADRRVATKNYNRDVTVLLSSGIPRKEGWSITPTWTRYKIGGWLKKVKTEDDYMVVGDDHMRGLYWRSEPTTLWEAWNGRPLLDPHKLFQTGGHPFGKPGTDRYLILHAEGMEYTPGKEHGAKSGTSLVERKVLINHVSEVMQDILVSDTPVDVDALSTLEVKDIFANQLWALYTSEDLRTSAQAIPVERGTGKSADDQRHAARRQVTDYALSVALGNKPLNIILAAQEQPARQVLEQYVREALFLEVNEPLPSCICITPLQLKHELNIPPGLSILEQGTKEDREKAIVAFPAEWEDKVRRWQTVVQPAIVPNAYNIVLAELSGRSDAITDKYTWRKSAARRGIYQAGASSQFVLTIPSKMAGDPTYFAPFVPAARSRVINGVRDAIIRQTGLVYGSLPELYQYAGLDSVRANELIVVALYRFRQKSSTKVDLPFAIELYPNGRVLVVLPNDDGIPDSPIPYIEASIELGKRFSRPMKTHWRNVNFHADQHDARLMTFAHAVITKARQVQSLVLMEADGWRQSYLKITTNSSIAKDVADLAGSKYTPTNLPLTALIRLRDAGTLNETPQFIAGDNPSWSGDEVLMDSEGMLGAIDRRGGLTHFYSVARQSATATEDQDNEAYTFGDGGDTAFRHQKIIELLPWFAANEDDRVRFSRIAHFLRFTPAWNRGNTVQPWPMHLAEAMARNVGDVFIPNPK